MNRVAHIIVTVLTATLELIFQSNLCKDCRSPVPNLPEICLLVTKVKDADTLWICARFEVLAVVLLRI